MCKSTYVDMKKLLFLLNIASVILVLFVNYYSQTGAINDKTVGSLSIEYNNLFTPASFAFAIWGMIFLGLILLAIFQGGTLFSRRRAFSSFDHMGFIFALVNLGNATWVIVWLYEFTFLSVLVMTGMLIGLLTILIRFSANMATYSLLEKLFVLVPVNIYAGWIAVATIANVAAFLSKLGWTGGVFSEVAWTIIMITIAVGANIFVTWTKSVKAFSLVGIWALYAIYARHESSYESIAFAALAGLIVLGVSTLAKVVSEQRILQVQKA